MEDLWSLPATAIAALVRSRSVSAREVTVAALARLDAVNPAINAVVDPLHESALAQADLIDMTLAGGADPGPAAGVPVTVKVNVDMAGRATTNGLRLQKDLVAAQHNPVVANMTRAGSIVIGRTNTPAFSIRWFTRNRLHGATFNPHNRALTPGGSSGGAGAAVAAGIGALGHGTDIAGSVRYPAYVCGVHGLRPSLGRVPAANFSAPDRGMGAQITAVSGPLARTIDDIDLGYRVMSAADASDPWWVPVPLDGPPLPRRVAVVAAPDGVEAQPEVAAAVHAAGDVLADAGWEVAAPPAPPLAEAAQLNMALWMAEFTVASVPKLAEEDDPDARIVADALLEIAARGPDPMTALQQRVAHARAWQRFLEDWPLVLCPVSAEVPFPDHLDLAGPEAFARVYRAQISQVALPVLGLPALSVAIGRPGEPMGVQLIAPRFREDHLIAAGRTLEAAFDPIRPVDPFVRE